MAVKRVSADIDVVSAAEMRVKNVFRCGLPVYLSFSGGKDSLCLAHIVLKLIARGEIDPAQLSVHFIDEEAIFPCIEKITMEWRRKFIYAGARFDWFCIEVKHYCCFNELQEDESFICWDRYRQDVWVRKPPGIAIRNHPLLRPRHDAYQDFLPRISADGITIVGVRAYESVQRLQNIARIDKGKGGANSRNQIFPIYDWRDDDVWLYLLREQVDIPEIYLFLWQAGTAKNRLRVSQFFSIDTARSLVRMNEYYPDLMERIIRREPNAYLAALYWDSEMFGRRSSTRRKLEADEEKDYRKLLLELFSDMDRNFQTPGKRKMAERYRVFFMRASAIVTQRDCRDIYDAVLRGDPKARTFRALYQQVFGRYVNEAKREACHGK